MTFDQTVNELTGFYDHENAQIAEFAKKLSRYARALETGDISTDEYRRLVGDVETLRRMARTADEQNQVVRIHQLANALLSLL